MALPATIHKVNLTISDVDRGVYDTFELRLARHPSESPRYMVARTLAYALSYADGITFSKGGLSSTEEAPVSIVDPTGRLLAWIDIGSPAASRLHKAAKAADAVVIYTWSDLAPLRKEAATVHRASEIVIVTIPASFLDTLAEGIGRRAELELLHTSGQLYATLDGVTHEAPIERSTLG